MTTTTMAEWIKNYHFDLASALVDEAAGHLIGRTMARELGDAFGVHLEVSTEKNFCTIEAHSDDAGLVAAATAVLRHGGTLTGSVDAFRFGDLMFWATSHAGPDTRFWAKGSEHYTLTAKVGTDTWTVATFSGESPFATLQAALEFIATNEAAAADHQEVAATA